MKRTIKGVIIIASFIFIALATSLLATNEPELEIYNSTLQYSPYRKAMGVWVDGLEEKESGGHPKDVIILDVNNKYSYGCLQYQMDTFLEVIRSLDMFPDLTTQQIRSKVLDCGLQRVITYKMIDKNYNYWQKWYTSVVVRGLGLPPEKSNFDIKDAIQ